MQPAKVWASNITSLEACTKRNGRRSVTCCDDAKNVAHLEPVGIERDLLYPAELCSM